MITGIVVGVGMIVAGLGSLITTVMHEGLATPTQIALLVVTGMVVSVGTFIAARAVALRVKSGAGAPHRG